MAPDDSITTLLTDLLDLHVPYSVRLSPNGQKLLYVTTRDQIYHQGTTPSIIWLAETGRPHSARQLTSGESDDREPKWSPNGESFAFVSDRKARRESEVIYLLRLGGDANADAVALTKEGAETKIGKFEWAPDGRTIAFLSPDEKQPKAKGEDANVWGEGWEFNRLRIVDVQTKEVTVLVNREAHVVDFAWSEDGKRIAFADVQSPDAESDFVHGTNFSVVDVETKEVRRLCHFPQHKDWNMLWVGDSVYFTGPVAEKLQTSSLCAFKIAVPSSNSDGVETKYEYYAHGESDCCWEMIKASGEVIGHIEDGMKDDLRILHGRTLYSSKRKLHAWDAVFASDSDEIILAIATSDTNTPAEIYTTTASGGALVQLSTHGQALKSKHGDFGSCVFLTTPSSDGAVELECPLQLPASSTNNPSADAKPSSPLPMVVLPHGGPYWRHNEAFEGYYYAWSQLLLKKGYAVLLADYRGSSGRGESWAAYARANGIVDYADVIALTNRAVELGYADRERLVIGGWSQGGFMTFLSAVRNGTHGFGWAFKAAIPGAGVSDLDTMIFTSRMGMWQAEMAGSVLQGTGSDKDGEPHIAAPWRLPKSDVSSRRGSAVWEIHEALQSGVKIPPMLILHGEEDKQVGFEQSVVMRRACVDLGLKFELVGYPRADHVITERGHLLDMGRRVLRWVETYIGKAEA